MICSFYTKEGKRLEFTRYLLPMVLMLQPSVSSLPDFVETRGLSLHLCDLPLRRAVIILTLPSSRRISRSSRRLAMGLLPRCHQRSPLLCNRSLPLPGNPLLARPHRPLQPHTRTHIHT